MGYNSLAYIIVKILTGITAYGCIVDRENSCTCDHLMRQVSCTRLGDPVNDVLPYLIPDDTQQLLMRRVWVDDAVELHPRNFDTLRHLIWLDFSFNRISVIHPGTFSDMRNLYYVNLSHNRLKLLEPNTFSGSLPELLSIDLSFNRLLVLVDRNFKSVPNLKFLDLRNNPILFISGEAFLGLSKLERLKLSSANFTKFPAEPLSALPNLRLLEMRDMPFVKSIPDHAFSFNNRLETLILEKFSLSPGGLSVDVFSGLDSLSRLMIASCNLTAVPCTSLSKVKYNLESLDLSRNSIQVVYPDDFSSLTSLKNLTLHNTNLQEIKPESFVNLKEIVFLDVSNNRLMTIYRDIFSHNLTGLKYILMPNNVWSCDCSLKWLAESHINLGRSHVTCTNPRNVRGESFIKMRNKLPSTFNNCLPPTLISKEYTDIAVDEGDEVTLECDAIGESLSFSWFFAETIVPIRGNDLRKNGRKNLVIRNVQINDGGEYTCVVRNAGGRKSIIVHLHVNAAQHGDMTSNFPTEDSAERRHSGRDCSTGTQNIRREASIKPGFPSGKTFEKGNTATTAILITILGCVTTLGVAGVFLFVGCVWSKRRDASQRFKNNSKPTMPVNGNGHCNLESGRNGGKKDVRSVEPRNEPVVFGGRGMYSKPLEELEPQHTDTLTRTSRRK